MFALPKKLTEHAILCSRDFTVMYIVLSIQLVIECLLQNDDTGCYFSMISLRIFRIADNLNSIGYSKIVPYDTTLILFLPNIGTIITSDHFQDTINVPIGSCII